VFLPVFPLLFAFIALGLVSFVLHQEIGRKNVSKMTYFVLRGT